MYKGIEGGLPQKEQATEMRVRGGDRLEDIVNQLLQHRERGELVFCNFSGHKLFSEDVTMDSAFLKITGKNKADFDKEQEDWLENYNRETEEKAKQAEAKIPSWIEMGKTLGIDPALTEDWEKMVRSHAGDMYYGMEIDAAIATMQVLNAGATAKDINKVLDDQHHTGNSYSSVRIIIEKFSPRGRDIYKKIEKLRRKQ